MFRLNLLPFTRYPLPVTLYPYPLPVTRYPLPVTRYPLPLPFTFYPLPFTRDPRFRNAVPQEGRFLPHDFKLKIIKPVC